MLMLLSIALISAAIAFVEGPPLLEKGMNKEFYSLMSLLLIAVMISVAKQFDFPTPLRIMDNLLSPIGKTIFKFR